MNKIQGLSLKEVQRLTNENKTNKMPEIKKRSNFDIVSRHIFTMFNLYNLIIALALIYIKAYTSLFFVGIIFSNTFMFSIQEIRSRNLINKLNIIVSPKVKVIRDFAIVTIKSEDLVLGDVIYLESGNQVPADSIIVEGEIEVNESLLTGEVEPVNKGKEKELLSGSFIVSGNCYARIIRVGADNYAYRITVKAKEKRQIYSVLIKTFKLVTKIISFFIIPIGSLLLYQGLVVRGQPFPEVIINTATALLGMLPQGLVLLTTVNLINSVLHLGSNKTLIQDLYAIEILSQVDVLCLDKTGTVTYGVMKVVESEVINEEYYNYMSSFINNTTDNNTTFKALFDYFSMYDNSYTATKKIPFSSSRKWSSITFDDKVTILVGAPDVLLPNIELSQRMRELRKEGARILYVVGYNGSIEKNTDLSSYDLKLGAVIALQDSIRDDANDALEFFNQNDVEIKIISGDNTETVYSIAAKAGVKVIGSAVDASILESDEDYLNAIMNNNVIGRATPEQKLRFVEILKTNKKKVAMIGDGINDVLALKKADCSIAMGEGSDVSLSISQVVIMDKNLTTLVDVFKEGRQVINSITRSASMYYLGTIITIFLSVISIIMNVPFPFIPFQVTLTNMFIDGFPSFMLLFEKNVSKPKESILQHVLRYSFPNAIAVIILWIIINLSAKHLGLRNEALQTIIFYINAFVSLHLIYRIYQPLNLYRIIILVIDSIGIVLGIMLFWRWLRIVALQTNEIIITVLACLISLIIINTSKKIVSCYLDKKNNK